jgi:hypothetical protein
MDSPRGEWIASWEAPVLGLRWIEELIEKGKAIKVGGNCGYPYRYASIAEHALLSLLDLPPKDGPRWTGREVVWSRTSAIDQCRLEEWLIVDLWDQS